MANSIADEDDFFKEYLPAGKIHSRCLQNYSKSSRHTVDDESRDWPIFGVDSPATAHILTKDYFSRPTYLIKVLRQIAQLYVFVSIEPDFLFWIELDDYESGHNESWTTTGFEEQHSEAR